MADLFLNWASLGTINSAVPEGTPTTLDTGGVEVAVTFNGVDPAAQAFIFSQGGYIAATDPFDPQSFLKLADNENNDASPTTSITTLDFSSSNPADFTDQVQNVQFRINDIDLGTDGDRGEAGTGWQDIVTIRAFDAAGNPVSVTLTPESGVTTTGDTATGTGGTTDFSDQSGSLLVDIAGPLQRIEIEYANGDTSLQSVTVTDVHFSTVDVDPTNGDPTAGDDSAATDIDTAIIIDTTTNDSDPDGDPLTYTVVTGPANGTLTPIGGGSFSYTPDTGFTGTDTFVYAVDDGNGGTDTASVAITVTDPVTNTPPTAGDDSAATDIDTPVIIDAGANDSDPDSDPLTYSVVTGPTNGTLVNNGDGTFAYTPDTGFTGTDTFTYEIDDGNGGTDTATVTIGVTDPVTNTPPTAGDDVAATDIDTAVVIDTTPNDGDPDGDTLTYTVVTGPTNGTLTPLGSGSFSYTPDTGFTGTDTFTYAVDDGNGGTDTATVTISVTDPVTNTPPTAGDDSALTTIDTPVVIDTTPNDSDPDSDPLTYTIVTGPTNGTLTDLGDGRYSYSPDTGFTGTDTFTYEVDDGNGGTDTATVTVSVSPVPIGIDTDVFPVTPGDQPIDPLDGIDQDTDPLDNIDNVTGTGGDDLISTGDDDDTITAGGGNDTILPGVDDDIVDLGAGDDSLIDIQGADTVFGGQGDDTIIAGFNGLTIDGRTFILSDYEDDAGTFDPGSFLRDEFGFESDPNPDDGRDSIQGNRGNDFILTGDDADTIDGGGENDTIDGGIDDDLIFGGQGDDSLIGSHGSDTIDGGQGDDFIDGSTLNAIDVGGLADLRLELPDDIDPNPDNDRDSLFGANGNDTILGGDDDDTLDGGNGDDFLDGGIDDDSIDGGDGADTLLGGDGNDTLNGGAGLDSIFGGADRDVIIVSTQTDMYDAATGVVETVEGGSTGDDFDTLDLSSIGLRGVDWRLVNTVTDSDGNGLDGTVEFLDGDGDVTGSFDFVNIELIVPCFTPGTLIATPDGERLVEDLEPGDTVITRDNGIQTIRWTGRKDLTGHDLARKPHMAPVLIRKGALGGGLPEHDMLVSPNHRVLVASDRAALYFDAREVLVAAKHLTAMDGIDEVAVPGVSYIHIMFDRHEVVLSNGAWTESFQPGDYSLAGIDAAQRDEIIELFPELGNAEGRAAYGAARRSLKRHEAALLVQ